MLLPGEFAILSLEEAVSVVDALEQIKEKDSDYWDFVRESQMFETYCCLKEFVQRAQDMEQIRRHCHCG